MSNKTSAINIMVEPEVKKKLLEKAKALNLSLTSYIEKIGLTDIVFMDSNLRLFFNTVKLEVKK